MAFKKTATVKRSTFEERLKRMQAEDERRKKKAELKKTINTAKDQLKKL